MAVHRTCVFLAPFLLFACSRKEVTPPPAPNPHKAPAAQEPAIIYHAASGNLDQVKQLVEQGTALEARHISTGQTALMAAAVAGHYTIVDYLVAQRADVYARDKQGRSVLDYYLPTEAEGTLPAREKLERLFPVLIAAGYPTNAAYAGRSLLYRAAIADAKRCDPNATFSESIVRRGALVGGPEKPFEPLVRLLLDARSAAPECQRAFFRLADLLQQARADMNEKPGGVPLIVLFSLHSPQWVSEWLKFPIDVNATVERKNNPGTDPLLPGDTALFAAVMSGSPDTWRVLLKHPTVAVNQRNQNGENALSVALRSANPGAAAALAQAGTECDRLQVHVLAQAFDVDLLKAALACPNARDIVSSTQENMEPVILQVFRRYEERYLSLPSLEGENRFIELIQILLEKGANPQGIYHKRPLLFAALEWAKAAPVRLLETFLNADKDALKRTTADGDTALIYLARLGKTGALETLLTKVKDERAQYLSQTNRWNETALHAAAQTGRADSIALLIRNGTPISSVDAWGRTALLQAEYSSKVYAAAKAHSRASDFESALASLHGVRLETRDNRGRAPGEVPAIKLTPTALRLFERVARENIIASEMLWDVHPGFLNDLDRASSEQLFLYLGPYFYHTFWTPVLKRQPNRAPSH